MKVREATRRRDRAKTPEQVNRRTGEQEKEKAEKETLALGDWNGVRSAVGGRKKRLR